MRNYIKNKTKSIKFNIFKSYIKVKDITGITDISNNIGYSILNPMEDTDKLKFLLAFPGITKEDVRIKITNDCMVISINNWDFYKELGYISYWSNPSKLLKFEFDHYKEFNPAEYHINFDKGMLAITFKKYDIKKISKEIRM